MLNLKGQAEKANAGSVDPSHGQMLQQAFASVLSDQVMQGQAEERAALERRQKLQNDDDENKEEDSSDIDFDDMDAELDRIENSRHAEMVQMNADLAKWKAKGNGVYDITIEADLMQKSFWDENEYVVLHFFHKNYERCKVLGSHLIKLAPQYYPVKFLSIDAEKAKFMVTKMQITILPTLVFFKDGKMVDKLVGFTELGNVDDFTTATLEKRMKQSGIMKKLKWHMTETERLDEDEKRNKSGHGSIYRVGGLHGPLTENNDE